MPASTAPAASVAEVAASTTKHDARATSLALFLNNDDVGTTLAAGFDLARTSDRAGLSKYLSALDARPAFAREAIVAGLARLPKDPAYADERAGLVDLIPRFAHGDAAWATAQVERELTEVPAAARPSRSTASTEAELDQASSVTPDIARAQLAFETLLAVQKDCRILGPAVARVLDAQTDELLRQNFTRRFQYACPSSRSTSSSGDQES